MSKLNILNKDKTTGVISFNRLPIFQNAYYWFIAPLVVVFLALIMGLIFNSTKSGFMNVGIDFASGTVLTVEADKADFTTGDNYEKNLEIIESICEDNGVKVETAQKGGEQSIIVRYKNEQNEKEVASKQMISINETIRDAVQEKITSDYNVKCTANAEMTNSDASSELLKAAFLSVGVALLLMLVYIIIRFDFFSAIAAIVAEFHDILMMLAFTIIFNVQVNSTYIAAVITIVSYTINNTIVIFDRVRENVKPYKQKKINFAPLDIVNGSVTDSLKRTLFSSLTTLITITVLACCGIQSLTEFALPIIFGLLAGLYSSTFIAPSVWGLMMQAKMNSKKKASHKKKHA